MSSSGYSAVLRQNDPNLAKSRTFYPGAGATLTVSIHALGAGNTAYVEYTTSDMFEVMRGLATETHVKWVKLTPPGDVTNSEVTLQIPFHPTAVRGVCSAGVATFQVSVLRG